MATLPSGLSPMTAPLYQELVEALGQIAALQPVAFDFPTDWSEQISACSECERYRDHPVQRGICDAHRRPLWDREKHDSREEKRLGYRAKEIARSALSRAQSVEGEGCSSGAESAAQGTDSLAATDAAPSGWLPIESAPCDGEVVVVGCAGQRGVTTVEWSSEARRDADLAAWEFGPTHWMRPGRLPADGEG